MSSIRFRYPFQQNGRRRSFFRSSRNRNTSWYGDLGNVNIKGDGSNGALLKAAVFTGTVSGSCSEHNVNNVSKKSKSK